jgi:hypothetical protein
MGVRIGVGCRVRTDISWEAAAKALHEKYHEATDGRIRFTKVMGT